MKLRLIACLCPVVPRLAVALCVGGCLLSSGRAEGPAAAAPARKVGEYHLTADSLPQEGVPKGQLIGPLEWSSKIIRGTVRRYWIYVPAQYTGDKPAGLLVFQDGQRALNP